MITQSHTGRLLAYWNNSFDLSHAPPLQP